MSKRIITILQYLFFLGAGVFLVWWQLKDMTKLEKAEFINAFHHANYWLIIPVALMSLLSHLLRSIRWKYLMKPMGYNPKLKNVFSVVMIGYLANSAIPRLGEILKCTFLAKYEKLQVGKLVGTIIMERTFDLLCFILFIGFTILIQINTIGNYVNEKIKKLGQTDGVSIWLNALLLFSVILMVVISVRFLFNRYPQNKLISKINLFIRGIAEGFKTVKSLENRKGFLTSTLLIWLLYLLQVYIGFWAMDGTAHLSIKAACSVLTLASLAMIVTPGGIGSFPLFVMQTLLIYQIESPLGKAFGWLIWGVSTGIVIVVGLTCLLIIPYLNRSKHENS